VPVFDIYAELAAIVDAFATRRVEHAVCGALALAVHGKPRATKDIDVLVAPHALESAKKTLRGLGYDIAAAPRTFRSGVTVHRVSRVESKELFTVDLILADGAVSAAMDDRIQLPWGERSIWVVSRSALVAMKRLADRPQDRADLVALGADEGADE
jgi:hypothetical protein